MERNWCLRCDGAGSLPSGETGRHGEEYADPCDRCEGDGMRRCDVLGCSSLATVSWPTNSDRFCVACVEADITTYFDALASVRKPAKQHDADDVSARAAFRLVTPAAEWPESALERLAKAVRR